MDCWLGEWFWWEWEGVVVDEMGLGVCGVFVVE